MANHLYGYVPSYAAATPSASATATVYGTATSRALSFTERYLSSSDPLKSSSAYLTASDIYSYTSATQASSLLAPGFDASSTLAAEPLLPPGIKRSTEALYYPTVMASHKLIGQTEDWYSTSPLLKRLKLESASNLSIYPQRPGEKDCAHYMLTRTCKFGDSCKFDHPIWVPEGGIPDWKEVPAAALSESLPERPGEPNCPYFLKTQRCKFGSKCKFNHPKDQAANLGGNADVFVLPERPSEPECAFYIKTGKCKFGANCKFHHPKDIQVPAITSQISTGENAESVTKIGGATAVVKPALYHNSKGLPLRLGEADCPFYLKTGSCKYSSSCRYNHPDRTAFDSLTAIGNPIVASPATSLNIGVGHPATSIYETIDPRLGQSTIIPMLGVTASIYPQRPGQTECDYYMKTGVCKFGERCKFHHPVDRSAPIGITQTAVKLTPAGLPRREGAVHCPYYMKTGTCKFGTTCKFDHPPPGEAVAMAATLGASTVVAGEAKGEANGGSERQSLGQPNTTWCGRVEGN